MVEEHLLDLEASGHVRWSSFAGSAGWSLTEAGKKENERRPAAELDRAGAREDTAAVHRDFLPLNDRFGAACTDRQPRPTHRDPMAANDHTDRHRDERVVRTLSFVESAFRSIAGRLDVRLERFSPYPDLYATALAEVRRGRPDRVGAPDRDSLHLVWIQFHEDLLATLGIPRGPGA